jgi:hypothetical protein
VLGRGGEIAQGIADAGTAAALHSAAPATKLIARAFMEHLLALLHLQSPNRDRSRVRLPLR